MRAFGYRSTALQGAMVLMAQVNAGFWAVPNFKPTR
jgi:hypothetical protein